MTRIRLYVDEDTQRRALVRAMRARDFDIVTTHEAGLLSVSDADQLAYSATVGRTLLTFNSRDFVQLHRDYLIGGKSHLDGMILEQYPDTGRGGSCLIVGVADNIPITRSVVGAVNELC